MAVAIHCRDEPASETRAGGPNSCPIGSGRSFSKAAWDLAVVCLPSSMLDARARERAVSLPTFRSVCMGVTGR